MSFESRPTRKRSNPNPLKINIDTLIVPATLAGGVLFYLAYKDKINDLVQKFIEVFPHAIEIITNIPTYPLPPINIPPIDTNPPTSGTSGFGGGAVSLHGLASGGSAWRKQWEVHRRYLNCEFRGYFLIPRGNDGISVKLRGGPHTSSSPKEGCCYIFFLPFNGSNKNNFQKECPHPNYDKNTVGTQFSPGSIIGKWTGIRCRVTNQGNGVRCQMWLDTSGQRGANQWRLWYDIIDNGQYGSGASKPPFTRSPVNGNSPQAIVRIDGDSKSVVQGYQMSNASIGEISSSNIALIERMQYLEEERITVPY